MAFEAYDSSHVLIFSRPRRYCQHDCLGLLCVPPTGRYGNGTPSG